MGLTQADSTRVHACMVIGGAAESAAAAMASSEDSLAFPRPRASRISVDKSKTRSLAWHHVLGVTGDRPTELATLTTIRYTSARTYADESAPSGLKTRS